VYDIEPRGRYCRALETAAERLIAHLRLPKPEALRAESAAAHTADAPRRGLLQWLGIGRAPAGEERTAWS
jgi:hypothetical protein